MLLSDLVEAEIATYENGVLTLQMKTLVVSQMVNG